MKIALITLSFPPQTGGVQTYLWEIGQRLAQRHEVWVVTPVQGEENGRLSRHLLPCGTAVHFFRALRELQPDRILVGHAHPQLLLAAYLYRQPFVALTYGNDYLAAQKRWHRPLFNWLLRQAQPLITITQANVAKLKSLGFSKPEIIFPGVAVEQFAPASEAQHGPRLLTVGRLVPRKGADMVLRAMPLILAHFPSAHYTIVGDGPYRKALVELVVSHNLESAVSFAGRVPDENLLAYYQAASLFVMPVREETAVGSMEGFGIVYLEAAACGLPVIAGRSGGAVEAIRDGETGMLVDPHDPEAIATAVLDLLNNPQKAAAMGGAGRRWAETEMSWERAAQRLAEILEA